MAIRRRADTGRWQVQLRNPITGTRQSKDFDRKADAEAWVKEMHSAEVTGTAVRPGAGRVTVAELAQRWAGTRGHLKPSARRTEDSKVRTHVLPGLGSVPVNKLRRSDVQRWLAGLDCAASTKRQAFFALSSILDLAVSDGELASNPAQGVKLPPAAKPAKRFLSAAEVNALIESPATERDRLVIAVAAYCGLRIGEVFALTVGSLDPLRRRLVVSRSVSEVGGELVVSSTKSHQQRVVGLPAALAERLAAYCAGRDRDSILFPDQAGGHLRLSNWRRRVFDPAVAATVGGKLTPHGLRAAFVGLAASTGANIKDVQLALGHSSAVLTLDRYSAAFPNSADRVADGLSVALETAPCNWNATDHEVIALPDRSA